MPRMTFGFTTPVDLLSWVVVLLLGAKLAATVIVLSIDRDLRDRPGWGSALWWVTKIAPVIAVPCLIAIALLDRDGRQLWLYVALGLFVLVAVPFKIRQRRNRIAARPGVSLKAWP